MMLLGFEFGKEHFGVFGGFGGLVDIMACNGSDCVLDIPLISFVFFGMIVSNVNMVSGTLSCLS